MADIVGPLRPADSWSVTEVRSITHNHVWTIRGFSQCECRYLETSAKVRDLSSTATAAANAHPAPYGTPTEPPMLTFRIRLHPQGNKESNKDFSFFQCFCNQPSPQYKAKYKFTVFNSRGEEIATTVYTGTQQLHGYFEYIRRDLLIGHVQPQDELQLVLSLTVTFDTVTKTNQVPKTLTVPTPKMSEVAKALTEYFKDGKMADFRVIVGDREIPAHKVVLSARSPYFAALLELHTEEAQTNKVILKDVDPDVMQELLFYMYSGTSPNLATYGLDLLAAAERFQVPGLKEMAEISLRSTLLVDTVCRSLVMAEMHNSQELKTDAIKFIANNVSSVIQTDGWQELARDHPQLMTEIVSHMDGEKKNTNYVSSSTAYSPSSSDQPPTKRMRLGGPASD